MFNEALHSAEASLGIKPGDEKALIRQGRALGYLSRFEEAKKVIKNVPNKQWVKHYSKFVDALSQ